MLLAGITVLFKPWQLAPADLLLVVATVFAAAAAALLVRRPSLIVLLIAIELSAYAVGINPVAAAADRLPRPELLERLIDVQAAEGGRIMGIDGELPGNLAGRYGLADLRAYDPLRPLPYAAMLRELGQTDPVLGGPLRIAPPGLAGAWSVRFLIAGPDRNLDGWEPVWRGSEGSLWRNPAWLPEVRVVGRTVTGGWDELLSGDVDLSTVAVVPEGSPSVAADRVALQLATVTGSRIEVASDCDGPCLVIAARPWATGWSAAVDGEPAPIVLANLAGLGVVAPAGSHRVVLDYRPWRWGDGVP